MSPGIECIPQVNGCQCCCSVWSTAELIPFRITYVQVKLYDFFNDRAHSKKGIFQKEHIATRAYFKKGTFQKGHILFSAHSKKKHILKRALSKKGISKYVGHIPKRALSKKGRFQKEHIRKKGAFLFEHFLKRAHSKRTHSK